MSLWKHLVRSEVESARGGTLRLGEARAEINGKQTDKAPGSSERFKGFHHLYVDRMSENDGYLWS